MAFRDLIIKIGPTRPVFLLKNMFNLFPKDGIFYQLFERQSQKLSEAARLLLVVFNDPQKLAEAAVRLKQLEKEADEVGHELMENLRINFITPMEGEDIDLLRQNLDDIIDFTERAVNRMVIYNIPRPFPQAIGDYAKIIGGAADEIKDGIQEVKNVKKFHESLHHRCFRLNELENAGDEINRRALGGLMNAKNVSCDKLIEIIKLKEIYETLENAIDACENVGNMFESILIKNQ